MTTPEKTAAWQRTAWLGATLLALLATAISVPARATTLAELFRGETITADDKLFSNWTLIELTTAGGGVASLGEIDVTPLAGDPLNPGVRYDAPVGALGTPFGHQGPAHVGLAFSYDVQTTNQLPLIKDNSLLLTDWIFDASFGASIAVKELVFDVTGLPIGQKHTYAVPTDFPGSGDPDHFDELTFAPPRSGLHVVTIVFVNGPGTNDGAFLTGFEQRFSQVPEPGTLALLGLGVGGLSARARRRGAARAPLTPG